MTEKTDHSSTLRSYSILGSSTVVTMLLSLVRVKVIALLLGPAGVGLMGLLVNIMSTASTLFGLGVGSSGTKQIAEQAGKEDQKSIGAARRALFWGTMLLAVLGGTCVFFLRHFLAEKILDDASLSSSVGWLAIGVALAIATSSQSALITGMRRVGDIAKIQIFSSLTATLIGLAFIWAFGMEGLVFHILAAPLAGFIISHWFVSRLPRVNFASSIPQITEQWNSMVRLGSAMMLAELINIVGQLGVRALIQRELGMIELGYFQASWGLSMIYLSFILAVLGTDYYSKLSGIIHDNVRANILINNQTEIALLMAAPVIIIMMGFLPWIINILYSSEFTEAAKILRWQVMADVLKIASFPLRFVILCSGRGRLFALIEALAMAIFLLFTWILLPVFGVEAAGMGFLIMWVVYLPVVYICANKITGFVWSIGALAKLIVSFVVLMTLFLLAGRHGLIVAALSLLISVGFGLYAVLFFSNADAPEWIKKISRGIFFAAKWIGLKL